MAIWERRSMFWMRKMHLNLFRWRKALAVMENIAGGPFVVWVTRDFNLINFAAFQSLVKITISALTCETQQSTTTLIVKQPQRHFENGLLFVGVCVVLLLKFLMPCFSVCKTILIRSSAVHSTSWSVHFQSFLLFFNWTARFFLTFFYSFCSPIFLIFLFTQTRSFLHLETIFNWLTQSSWCPLTYY